MQHLWNETADSIAKWRAAYNVTPGFCVSAVSDALYDDPQRRWENIISDTARAMMKTSVDSIFFRLRAMTRITRRLKRKLTSTAMQSNIISTNQLLYF